MRSHNFIEGQKVASIINRSNVLHTIDYIDKNGNIKVKGFPSYYINSYETVITNINDVVVGMTLTIDGSFCDSKLYELKVIVKKISIKHNSVDVYVYIKSLATEINNIGIHNFKEHRKDMVQPINFVPGQKIIKISDKYKVTNDSINVGDINYIRSITRDNKISIDGIAGNWNPENFETVITCYDDIVKGMLLTLKDNEEIIVKGVDEYGVSFSSNGDLFSRFRLQDFKEYKPMLVKYTSQTPPEYVVVKPFNFNDLYISGDNNCAEFKREFSNLLLEFINNQNLGENQFELSTTFKHISDVLNYRVLTRHLSYLEEKGFIKIKSHTLMIGDKLNDGTTEHVFEVVSNVGMDLSILYRDGANIGHIISDPTNRLEPFKFRPGFTLDNLRDYWRCKTSGVWRLIPKGDMDE